MSLLKRREEREGSSEGGGQCEKVIVPDRDAKLSSVIMQTAFISETTWGKRCDEYLWTAPAILSQEQESHATPASFPYFHQLLVSLFKVEYADTPTIRRPQQNLDSSVFKAFCCQVVQEQTKRMLCLYLYTLLNIKGEKAREHNLISFDWSSHGQSCLMCVCVYCLVLHFSP